MAVGLICSTLPGASTWQHTILATVFMVFFIGGFLLGAFSVREMLFKAAFSMLGSAMELTEMGDQDGGFCGVSAEQLAMCLVASPAQQRIHLGPPPVLQKTIHSEFFALAAACPQLPPMDALLSAAFSTEEQAKSWFHSACNFVKSISLGAVPEEAAILLHMYTQEWVCYQHFDPDPNKAAGGISHSCFNQECTSSGEVTQVCGMCEEAWYCSEQCMKKHWGQHKWPTKDKGLDCNNSPYKVVNAALRNRAMPELTEVTPFCKLLLLSFGSLEFQCSTVFRALSHLPTGTWEAYAKCQEGDEFCFDNFNSTSTDRTASEHFLGEQCDENRRVLLIIHAVAAFPVSTFSDYPAEAELVLPPGSQFKVLSAILKDSDPSFVELQVQQLPLQREISQAMGTNSASSGHAKPTSTDISINTDFHTQNPLTRKI
jgi:hypothetical protein